jgi:hypothetical protein
MCVGCFSVRMNSRRTTYKHKISEEGLFAKTRERDSWDFEPAALDSNYHLAGYNYPDLLK